jgi:hypothetical protein
MSYLHKCRQIRVRFPAARVRRKGRLALILLTLTVLFILGPLAAQAPAAAPGTPPAAAKGARTILDLQPFSQQSSIRITNARGEEGSATLINLNQEVNVWYLLRLSWNGGVRKEDYHLENANPHKRKILLDAAYPGGLVLQEGAGRSACDLWKTAPRNSLTEARASGATYAPLCGGACYLRNPAKGYRTAIESAAEFLRDNIPAGEKIETFLRDEFIVGTYREKAKTQEEQRQPPAGPPRVRQGNLPASAWLDPRQRDQIIASSHLGIDIGEPAPQGISPGSWYPAKDIPGVSVSLIAARMIAPEILGSYRRVVSGLDAVEADSLVYLCAFDLDRFEIKFSRGTDHPRVGWADRVLERMQDKSLPGPDGIGDVAPLVSTGLISPGDAVRTAAAFTGGFKRTHGAFIWGELATRNAGSHYGFIESGVVFSRLQPGLSTLYTLVNGRMEMDTWTESENRLLPGVASARQNGVPIITAFDPVTAISVPGPLVTRWGEGNWSGSQDKKLRTLRAGAAVQEIDGKRFLVYAVFTSATPSAMARVFQAYRCRYAMLLDMNALELTYMAVYKRQGPNLIVQHLIRGMAEVDRSVKGKYLPRFFGYPDNRDFFYLLRKEAS